MGDYYFVLYFIRLRKILGSGKLFGEVTISRFKAIKFVVINIKNSPIILYLKNSINKKILFYKYIKYYKNRNIFRGNQRY